MICFLNQKYVDPSLQPHVCSFLTDRHDCGINLLMQLFNTVSISQTVKIFL